MAEEKKGKPENLLVALDLLWDADIPLQVRIRYLVATYGTVDTNTISRLLDVDRQRVRNALKLLARKGQITRRAGRASLVIESLPDVPDYGLKVLRGLHGKMKKPGIPTPLKKRLLALRECQEGQIVYRLPADQVAGLITLHAFEEPRFWVKTLPGLVADNRRLKQLGDGLLLVAKKQGYGDDVEGMNTTEAVVSFFVFVVEKMHEQRDRPVMNPCGAIRAMMTRFAAGKIGADDDLLDVRNTAIPWLNTYGDEPVEARRPVWEHLEEARKQEGTHRPPVRTDTEDEGVDGDVDTREAVEGDTGDSGANGSKGANLLDLMGIEG